ncbi:DDE superfamily endonuclease [Popillia japonica]|uniref:DDE superfamily endonuclease n=1 Tax=Popillia japonica TaxID=7064 RepID=A0AAW1LQS1_POPJA
MVRKYERTPGSRKYGDYNEDNLVAVMDAVKSGMSKKLAANAQNLYNYDETNSTDDPGAKRVVVPRNIKRVERVQELSSISIGLMVCGNATGDLLPPMMVYKALNIYENWTQGGTKYASSLSGWFDMNLFEVWFFKILLSHIEATREDDDKVVVVGDNLVCHFFPKVIQACIQACRNKSIYMTPFPENATHLMQPLDVAVFTPIKKKWWQILDQWRKESRYPGSPPKEQFPQLLQRLWIGIGDTVSENLKSAFRGTGLHPVNPDEVLKRISGELETDSVVSARTLDLKRIPGELETDSVVSARTLDDSLIELPKEHRGTCEETKPKRGKKIVPGANMSVVDEPAYKLKCSGKKIVPGANMSVVDEPAYIAEVQDVV